MKKIPFAPRITPYRNQHQLAYARGMRRNPTASEAALFTLLRRNALGFKVKRQVVAGPYVVDLLVASVGLVIEIDGSAHYGQEHNDAHRQRELELLGFEVARFSAAAVVAHPAGVTARIASTSGGCGSRSSARSRRPRGVLRRGVARRDRRFSLVEEPAGASPKSHP
ncbi:hypothetical protein BH09MYX1_BH09MYX1_66200 [soil metagenome]